MEDNYVRIRLPHWLETYKQLRFRQQLCVEKIRQLSGSIRRAQKHTARCPAVVRAILDYRKKTDLQHTIGATYFQNRIGLQDNVLPCCELKAQDQFPVSTRNYINKSKCSRIGNSQRVSRSREQTKTINRADEPISTLYPRPVNLNSTISLQSTVSLTRIHPVSEVATERLPSIKPATCRLKTMKLLRDSAVRTREKISTFSIAKHYPMTNAE